MREGALRGMLGSTCTVCRRWSCPGGAAVCADCVAVFAQSGRARCPRCAAPSALPGPCAACRAAPPRWEAAVAAVDYRAPWDRLLVRFKASGDPGCARAFAGLVVAALQRARLPPVDLVAPVPLARGRLAERGFNQAWELARRVAALAGLPAEPMLIDRIIETPRLAELDAGERRAVMRQAFSLDGRAGARVRGKRVALVDDVMTSGATLGAAALALRRAGAGAVQVWVAARTPAPGETDDGPPAPDQAR